MGQTTTKPHHLNIQSLFFLKIHPWNMQISSSFIVIFKFRFVPANEKYVFMELTSFKSLFLVTFLASTLYRRLHLFVKFSCWRACENLDATCARSVVCFSRQCCSWAKRCRWRHYDCAFYIYVLLMYTTTLSIEAQ